MICSLCDGFGKKDFPIQDKILTEKLADFLLTFKRDDNLYEFNNYYWDLQDDGIASVWAGIALMKSFELLKKQIYFEETLSVYNAILENLYSPQTSLVHTKGQNFWCANAAAQFAYLSSLILKYDYSDEVYIAMINSINICTMNIKEDGHFPYDAKHHGTYILLYHPNVMFFLNKCLGSDYLDEKIKTKINEVNRKGLVYLLERLDSEMRFNEPDFKDYNYYIITAVTSLASIKGKIKNEDEIKILNNILKFHKNGKLYLFIDNNSYLLNRKYYKLTDILLTETLYWLVQYKYK